VRWLVMGAGATGGYFGGRLAEAGIDVTFIARGAHLAALQSVGLRIQSPLGDLTQPVTATSDPAGAGPVDVILFAVKSYDTHQAAGALVPAVGPDTTILCVQNGVENEDVLAARFGPERILGGATRIEAALAAPGVIAHRSPFARFDFGPWSGPSGKREQAILDDLLAARVTAALHEDGRRVVWEKFLFLCAIAALTSVTRSSVGQVVACAESRELLSAAMTEIVSVAAKRGVDLGGEQAVAQLMQFVGTVPPAMRSSMQNDLEAGRRFELESLSGAVVRLGREAGVATPVHTFVYAALKPALMAAEKAHTA
jgi:2-dehydropantoate 2-reductase